jgi:hypothetical protein
MAKIVVGSLSLTQPLILYPGLGPAMLDNIAGLGLAMLDNIVGVFFYDKHGVFSVVSKLIEQFDVLKYRGPVKTEQCYQTSRGTAS